MALVAYLSLTKKDVITLEAEPTDASHDTGGKRLATGTLAESPEAP